MSDNDWYWLGKERVISDIALASELPKAVVGLIYDQLSELGFIDYDFEKEFFYDLVEIEDDDNINP